MVCKFCKSNPVITLVNNDISLCKSCFIKYFEKKARKTITQYSMIKKKDHIGLALSGGKDSSALLHLLNALQKQTGIFKLSAILIDEGIANYRAKTKNFAKKICKKEGIKLNIVSFKDEFGRSLDQLIKKSDLNPCTTCGVLRRYLLNKYSLKYKFTKLATAHNLDDESQSVLMNFFKNNMDVQKRLGPVTGVIKHPSFVPRIKPFYFLTEKEIATYAFVKKLMYVANCPYHTKALRQDVRNLINDFEARYQGTKHSFIQSFLHILPLLKKDTASSKNLILCKRCKQPSSNNLCKTCKLIENLK